MSAVGRSRVLGRTVLQRGLHSSKMRQAAPAGDAAAVKSKLPKSCVAGIIFNLDSADRANPELLLIQRGKAPNRGEWTFPGGHLELGETMAQGVRREVQEETGLEVTSVGPVATAVDVITHQPNGEVAFHFTVIDLYGFARGTPRASDDALAASWLPIRDCLTRVPCHRDLEPVLKLVTDALTAERIAWPDA
ncbi:uncharacterized protein MONBRDRAFT_36577 [Monosiga brevicollis MX1]|uniref:Nudix hydrolase domain-containing protein n=1 Tax=Monosiga brevicollis TaxID=81824 RepID=A9UW63_MONBE|nr:uncharacterized protein MONBRDRAFT_36577 [Monosiga brevicollis MX1]EDQ90713.1 predicted protein [Monosiga brevicollis MX1]|eukprot:XP_001744764.1 hypothetical protein [Monosiga brevicollis MX1]